MKFYNIMPFRPSDVKRMAAEYKRYREATGMKILLCSMTLNPEGDDPFCDTLVTNLRPWTQQQFDEAYAESDSIALMAKGIMFSKSGLRPDQTKASPGSLASLY